MALVWNVMTMTICVTSMTFKFGDDEHKVVTFMKMVVKVEMMGTGTLFHLSLACIALLNECL